MAGEELLLAPLSGIFFTFLVLVALWDGVWKAIALWKSARNSQLVWFICIVIFNTAGILPIIYIAFFQKKAKVLVGKKKK